MTLAPVSLPPERHRLAVMSRRIRWQLHWALHGRSEALVARSWWSGMTLLLPHSGSAAIAFCRTFPSRAVASWMLDSIRPGATVVDVGAHAGVYSLLAARLVTDAGVVHAIEPQQELLSLLTQSAELNGLLNVKGHRLALTDSDGGAGLNINPRSSGAFTVRPGESNTQVRTATLETFARSEGVSTVGLLKVDAAGNELAVLRGAESMLEHGSVGTIICKLYHPDVVNERFGSSGGAPLTTAEFLRERGYSLLAPDGAGADPAQLEAMFGRGMYSVPVLAKRNKHLARSKLSK